MSDIPSTWQWSTIGDVSAYVQRGKSPKYIDKSDLPVINQKCIRWAELQHQHIKYVHPEQFSAWDEARFIKAGDVLWNSTGTGTVGRAYHVKQADCTPPKVVDSHVTIVRAAPELDARYLFNWIKGPEVQSKIEEMCDGTTNQIELSRTAIAATAIPIAPREEQTRIANQLDTLLTRIQSCNDRFDAIPALLKRFRQAVLSAGTTGALTADWRESDSTESWDTCTIGQVLNGKPRNGYSPQAVDYATPIRSLTLSATTTGKFLARHSKFIDEAIPEDSYLWLEPGDILIQRANSLEHVGVSAIFDGDAKQFIYPDLMMRCRPNERIKSKYLFYTLSAESTRDYFRKNATGTAGNMPKINQQTVMSAPLLLPPMDEQAEIVHRVEALLALADRIEARTTAARPQAQRLSSLVLSKAFRGELVQQDPQDEPASVLLQRIAATQPAKAKASRGRPRTKTQEFFTTPEGVQPDASALPDGVWEAPDVVDEHSVTAMLVAVLKTWCSPMPQMQARLAAVLCLQPRQMTAALPAEQAAPWQRLVGSTADPLPTQVARLQPATDSAWRKALVGMRARGDLVEEGSGPQATWALGPGAGQIETAGWPEGRAGWVVAHLRAHGAEAILPLLEPLTVEFVHARACLNCLDAPPCG